MPLTAAQHADIIRAHWALLWPLPTIERMRVLDEIIADYEFEEQIALVGREMEVGNV